MQLKWILSLLVFSSFSVLSKPLLLVQDEADPPYMYSDVRKQPAGIEADLAREIFARIKQPYELKTRPWRRAIALAIADQAALIGCYKDVEREKKLDYSEPFARETLRVFTSPEMASTFRYQKVTDLYGRRVGILHGWVYGEEFNGIRDKLSLEAVDTDLKNFRKLSARHLDIVIATEESGKYLMSQPEFAGKVTMQPIPMTDGITYIAFSKNNPDRLLIPQINQALIDMRADGTYDRLVKQSMEYFFNSNK